MALKTPVVDRVPTYPGRVTLTPVGGQTNVYDLTRSDVPIEEGTPINKKLLDQKAYTLTENATVYVSGSAGSDITGDGTNVGPYATVQKAIDSLPKCLGGFHAQIDIADGVYEERVTIDGFYGGRLTLGVKGKNVTLRGITVMSSDGVRINVPLVKYSASQAGNLVQADYGSNVSILSDVIIHGENGAVSGLAASRGSVIVSSATVEIRGCKSPAVYASGGARIALGTINGTSANTSYGLRAEMGGVISFSTQGLVASLGNSTGSGGRILSGSGTTMASASIE